MGIRLNKIISDYPCTRLQPLGGDMVRTDHHTMAAKQLETEWVAGNKSHRR